MKILLYAILICFLVVLLGGFAIEFLVEWKDGEIGKKHSAAPQPQWTEVRCPVCGYKTKVDLMKGHFFMCGRCQAEFGDEKSTPEVNQQIAYQKAAFDDIEKSFTKNREGLATVARWIADSQKGPDPERVDSVAFICLDSRIRAEYTLKGINKYGDMVYTHVTDDRYVECENALRHFGGLEHYIVLCVKFYEKYYGSKDLDYRIKSGGGYYGSTILEWTW